MAKGLYIGVSSKARKGKKAYIGVGGVARKIKKMYIGVGGKARLCWSGGGAKTLRDAAVYTDPSGTSTTTERKVCKSEQEIPNSFTQISYPSDLSSSNGLYIAYDYVNKRFIGTEGSNYGYKIFYMPDDTDTWTFRGSASSYPPLGIRIDPKDGNFFGSYRGYGPYKVYITGSSITVRIYNGGSNYLQTEGPMEKVGDYYVAPWRYSGSSSSYGSNYNGGYVYVPATDIDTATTCTILTLRSGSNGAIQAMQLAHGSYNIRYSAIAYINGKYCVAFVEWVTNSVNYRYDFRAYCNSSLSSISSGQSLYQPYIKYFIAPLAIIGNKMFFEANGSPVNNSGSYITSTGIYAIDFSTSGTLTLSRVAGPLQSDYFNYYCDYFTDGTKVYIGNSRQGGTVSGTSSKWLGGYKYSSNGTSWTAVNFSDCSDFRMDKVKEKDSI